MVNSRFAFRHVAFKTLRGMQWAYENLNDNDYYSSCDDDMMVNLGQLQENIEKYNDEKTNKNLPEFPLICCSLLGIDWEPIRNKLNKNYVALEDYKWNKWPNFCLGGMYTTSVSVIKDLLKVSKTTKPIATDDVWITGILRNILGMPESMLVFPQPAIATHLDIYGRNNDDRATKIFHNNWSNTYKTFSMKSNCKC